MAIYENITPFKYAEDIIKHIPEIFIQNEDGLLNYNWFLNPPKFTTFRVNVKKYKCQDIIDDIYQQLLKESQIRNTEPPKVFIHKIIDDCIVIPNWKQDYKKDSCDYKVIVDVVCANAVLRGADIFAPGILSLSSNAKIGDKVNIFVDIERKCKRGFNKPFTGRTIFIGGGTVKMTRNELFKHNVTVRGIGVEVNWNLPGTPRLKFSEGTGLLQNFPSIVCGHLFRNISGNILDMCAAPGNKTTHIASILGDKGEVIALDKTPEKVSRIGKLCQRFGLKNVRYYLCNSTKCICENEGENNSPGPPFKKESFSAVLLDPPCSALGQRPSLMNEISPSQLKSYVSLQRQLFRSAVKALSKGGLLVYSTCTITVEENEEMVSWALKHFPEIILKKVEPSIGHRGIQDSLVLPEKFQHILRIMGTNIDGKRKVMFAMTAIKGVGRRYANIVLKKADVDLDKRAGECSEEEVEKIVTIMQYPRQYKIPDWFLNRQKDIVDGKYTQLTSSNLDSKLREDLERLKKIRAHRGMRHYWGLRVRGQHTKTTGRRGRTVGVSKKK